MKILVGLSGGVDSAVVAYLLREAGHEVSCGFMINYISDTEDCPTLADIEEARKVAEYLELPFHTFDFREEYEKRIVNYIYEGYQK
jgi:tRNA-specific 2-thiouridylase